MPCRFATFLLSDFTGRPTDVPPPEVDEGTCWGHLGATYGWNSVAFFTPGNNLTISVATNTETDEQAGPSDAYCVAYNRVRQIVDRATGKQKGPIQDWCVRPSHLVPIYVCLHIVGSRLSWSVLCVLFLSCGLAFIWIGLFLLRAAPVRLMYSPGAVLLLMCARLYSTYVADGYFGTCVCPDTKFVCNHGECEISAFGTLTYGECSTSCPRD